MWVVQRGKYEPPLQPPSLHSSFALGLAPPGRADCQLLKVFLLAWVFSLPFVIVEECGYFTPFVMALIAIAFFGLDQVGAELENPRV